MDQAQTEALQKVKDLCEEREGLGLRYFSLTRQAGEYLQALKNSGVSKQEIMDWSGLDSDVLASLGLD